MSKNIISTYMPIHIYRIIIDINKNALRNMSLES